MSVFNTQCKTFKTNITGEELELKVNNAVFIILKNKYKLKQSEWAQANEEENAIAGCKFIASVLEANGYKVTVQEVAENTNLADIAQFLIDYQSVVWGGSNTESEEGSEGK